MSTTVRPVSSRPKPAAHGDERKHRSGRGLGTGDVRDVGQRLLAAVSNPGVTAWFTARVVVFAALALARFLETNLHAEDPAGRPASGLVGWDASWYLRIIESGYHHLPWESLRFFPLLPMSAKLVSPLAGPRLALLLVVNVASLGAGILLERLVRFETGDRAAASRAAWFLALLPPAFVLVMGYAESMLLCFAIATFAALRRRRWVLAAVLGLLAGLCRPLGVVLVLPALVEAVRDLREAGVGEKVQRLLAVAAPGVGGLAYLAWSWIAYGDPMRPLRLQQEFDRRGGFKDPVSRLIEAFHQLTGGADLGSGLHFPWAVGFLVLLVVCFRRLPVSYGVFAGAILLLALSAGNLDSLERYGLSAFPLLIALATLVRPAWLEKTALVVMTTGLVTYATLAFLGSYVP